MDALEVLELLRMENPLITKIVLQSATVEQLNNILILMTYNESVLELDLSNIAYHNLYVDYLVFMLKNNKKLLSLSLTNFFLMYPDTMTGFVEALRINQTLTNLRFTKTKFHVDFFPCKFSVILFATMLEDQPPRSLSSLTLEGIRNVGILMRALANNTTLQYFDMSGSIVEPDDQLSIGDMIERNTTLLTLNLRKCNFLDRGIIHFAKCLASNLHSKLLDLNLSHNQCYVKGGQELGTMLSVNTTLKKLDLSSTYYHDDSEDDDDDYESPEGINAIFVGLTENKKSGLEDLNVSRAVMDATCIEKVTAMVLVNTKLKKLDISHPTSGSRFFNENGQEIVALFEALKLNTRLEVLNMTDGGIYTSGFTAIGNMLATNRKLRILILRSNYDNSMDYDATASQACATAIALGLKNNTTLRKLDITDNSIDDVGATLIAESLKVNKSLTYLAICSNRITKIGFREFTKALKTNNTLEYFDSRGNESDDGDDMSLMVEDMFIHNYALTDFRTPFPLNGHARLRQQMLSSYNVNGEGNEIFRSLPFEMWKHILDVRRDLHLVPLLPSYLRRNSELRWLYSKFLDQNDQRFYDEKGVKELGLLPKEIWLMIFSSLKTMKVRYYDRKMLMYKYT